MECENIVEVYRFISIGSFCFCQSVLLVFIKLQAFTAFNYNDAIAVRHKCAKYNIRSVRRRKFKLGSGQFLACVIAVHLGDGHAVYACLSVTANCNVLVLIDHFPIAQHIDGVLHIDSAGSDHQCTVSDFNLSRIGNGKGNHRLSCRVIVFTFHAAYRIWYIIAGRSCRDADGTVVQAQRFAQHVRHLHILSAIQFCLIGVVGNPECPIQAVRRDDLLGKSIVLHRIFRGGSKAFPGSVVTDRICSAVLSSQSVQICAFFQQKVIANPVIAETYSVAVHRQ